MDIYALARTEILHWSSEVKKHGAEAPRFSYISVRQRILPIVLILRRLLRFRHLLALHLVKRLVLLPHLLEAALFPLIAADNYTNDNNGDKN